MKAGRIRKKIYQLLFATLVMFGLSMNVHADTKVNEIKGNNRVETSVKSSADLKSDEVVIASARNYADSLSSYNIAAKNKAKVILVDKNTDVHSILNSIKPKKVYLIGGEKTLGIKVIDTVKLYSKDAVHVFGKNRYDTNNKTLEIAGYNNVAVADGRGFSDSLSAMSLLKSKQLGLMLVDGSKRYTTHRHVEYTIGGKNSVLQDAGKRISGKNRYQTNEMILNEIGKIDVVAVADGNDFSDALSIMNIINSNNNTGILIVGKNVQPYQKKILEEAKKVLVVGGAIDKSVSTYIKDIEKKEVKDEKNTTNVNNNPNKNSTNKNKTKSSNTSKNKVNTSDNEKNSNQVLNDKKDSTTANPVTDEKNKPVAGDSKPNNDVKPNVPNKPTPSTETGTQPTGPSTQPTGPSTQPTGPSTQPTGPSTQPTGPSTEPAGPSTEPTGENVAEKPSKIKLKAEEEIKKKILNFETNITYTYESSDKNDLINNDDIQRINKEVNDMPGMFRTISKMNGRSSMSGMYDGGKIKYTFTINLTLSYRVTKEQKDEYINKLNSWVAEHITPNMTDEQKVKTIHDWIIDHSVYTLGTGNNTGSNVNNEGINVHTPEAIMLTPDDSGGVCEAYATLFYELAKKSGLDVYYVVGDSKREKIEGEKKSYENVGHAWDLVKVDGKWYHIDCTWDDPIYYVVDLSGKKEKKNMRRYDFYLKNDATMRSGEQSHEWNSNENKNMPKVSDENYPQNYESVVSDN